MSLWVVHGLLRRLPLGLWTYIDDSAPSWRHTTLLYNACVLLTLLPLMRMLKLLSVLVNNGRKTCISSSTAAYRVLTVGVQRIY